jgi:signal transduction histidine kinase
MQKQNLDVIKNKLESENWAERLDAVSKIDKIGIPVDDEQEEKLIALLIPLSDDPKWEVRRAVASTLANFRYIKVKEIIDKLAVDSNKWVKETAERTRRKLKISASTDKRDRKYDYVLGLIRRLKKKYPEELNDEILDDILKSVLEVGERYYEELASDAAHQINTALTALDHASEELQAKLPKRGKSKKEVEELFGNFLEQKEYLKKIVRDLRIYSEPYDTDFTSERLDSILEEALVRAKNNVCPPQKNVSFREIIKIEPSLTLDAHREGLINAFTNIICNAFEAMPGGGALEITATSTRPGYITVVISDTGMGMTSKQIEDAKKRWSTSKREGIRRIGLGLPIAIKIIESGHKGKVTIESEKNKGTRVSIELPIQKEEESSL